MKELTDIQVKIIMNAFVTHADMINCAEKEAFRTRNLPEAERYPEPDLDLWLMYDVANDAYNVVFWPRASENVPRQPMLYDYHHEAGRYLSLMPCTTADISERDWEWHSSPYDAAIVVWREALKALREWTILFSQLDKMLELKHGTGNQPMEVKGLCAWHVAETFAHSYAPDIFDASDPTMIAMIACWISHRGLDEEVNCKYCPKEVNVQD